MKSVDKDLKLLQHQSHCKSDVQYRISRDYVSVGWKKGIFGNFQTTRHSLNICQMLITQCYAAMAPGINHFAENLKFFKDLFLGALGKKRPGSLREGRGGQF